MNVLCIWAENKFKSLSYFYIVYYQSVFGQTRVFNVLLNLPIFNDVLSDS